MGPELLFSAVASRVDLGLTVEAHWGQRHECLNYPIGIVWLHQFGRLGGHSQLELHIRADGPDVPGDGHATDLSLRHE